MPTEEQELVRDLTEQVQLAVNKALQAGYVVTVETVPDQPLAMGSYHLKVELRPGRSSY